jgi:hypothetical protein
MTSSSIATTFAPKIYIQIQSEIYLFDLTDLRLPLVVLAI